MRVPRLCARAVPFVSFRFIEYFIGLLSPSRQGPEGRATGEPERRLQARCGPQSSPSFSFLGGPQSKIGC
jgi:hypothetical protein